MAADPDPLVGDSQLLGLLLGDRRHELPGATPAADSLTGAAAIQAAATLDCIRATVG